ncbi:MAG: DMT family transporter [Chloroflexota bacterium]
MNLLGVACALGAAVIWGGVYVVAKYVLDFIPPLTLVALRYAIALVVLVAVTRLSRTRPVARADLPAMAALGLVGFAISIVAQFAGTHLSTAANGALITTATPVLVAVFAYFILAEPLVPRHLLGLGLALAGVLVVSDPASANLSPDLLLGNLLLVVASVTYALYSVLAKRASFRYPVLTVTTYATLFGLAFTAPFAPAEWALFGAPAPEATTPLMAAGVFYLGVVGTAVAFYLWNKGMALLDASAAAVCFFAQPVVGGLLGWLLLGERLGLSFFLGAALIFLGVGVVSFKRTAP